MESIPDYTARNSRPKKAETVRAIERYRPQDAIAISAFKRSEALRKARSERAISLINDTFKANASGDPYLSGINDLKLRLLAVRDAQTETHLHRADVVVRGMITGAASFSAITQHQAAWLRKLADNAYEMRLGEIQK